MAAGVLESLDHWFGHQLVELTYGSPPWKNKDGLLMGFPIWGKDFIDTFLKYTLPSLLSRDNAEALAGRCRIVIFSSYKDAPHIWAGMKHIESTYDIQFQMGLLSPDVMELTTQNRSNRYWILGTAGNLLLHIAGRSGMAFHMLQPDHVYSDRFCPNLFDLSKKYKAMAHTSISASLETAGPELDSRRDSKGMIAIRARDLGDLAWRHIHPRSQICLMNRESYPDHMPKSHFMLWQARDKLICYCWHHNATYIGPDHCANAPVRLLSTMDTQLPWYMVGEVAFPAASDEMTFIELSDNSKGVAPRPEKFTFNDFARRCWSMVQDEETHMPFMKVPSEVPIWPQDTFIEESEIHATHAKIVESLVAARADVTPLY